MTKRPASGHHGWPALEQRAARHAALGDPHRLAIVDDLRTSDRSPKELAERHGIGTNLLAHHLDVLERVGLVDRVASTGDRRRRYVRLTPAALAALPGPAFPARRDLLFLCTHNSARSQLGAALWTSRTGRPAASAGTQPADRVHRGAIAAARRAGLDLRAAEPRPLGRVPAAVQVITVCDRVHEELEPAADWWHWSVPDPVAVGTAAAFDAALAELAQRIEALTGNPDQTRSTT